MAVQDSINRFVDVMIDSKEKFEIVREEFETKNKEVENAIREFRSGVSGALQQRIKVDGEDLQALYDGMVKGLQDLLDNVATSMENTQKGMKFISDYEQSFNVAVFGKVKAGKSYLGNFIMGNVIRDLGIQTSYDKLERPKVEVYDRGKRSTQEKLSEISEEGNDGFRVDPNEATSAIQLFRLGGLTWFDTPGIGSVTWENEMLAKDYVDNADLVVYTSNSDAAGTRQDFTEMKELYDKGKAFLLLLTQSDAVEEDCDDEGEIVSTLVPKSPDDRRDTEQYMCNTLRDIGITNLVQGKEILTISTKLALTALENNDAEMYEASNMGRFLDILTSITQNDGASLKLKTPMSRINATILEITEKLKEANEQLVAYGNDLKNKKEKMGEKNELLSVQMQQECLTKIRRVIRQKSNEIEDRGAQLSGAELGELLSNEVYQVLLKHCVGEFAESGELLSQYTEKIRIDNVGELKMRTDTISYTVKEVYRVERDPKGLLEHFGSFLFDRKYYETKTRDKTKSSVVQLGVNEQDIMQLAEDGLNTLFEDQVPEMMEKISGYLLEPIIQLQESACRCICDTERALENLRC